MSDLLNPTTPEPRQPERKSASHGEAGYPRAAFDFYPTEPWVTRALLAAVNLRNHRSGRAEETVWEPACGDGRMAKEIADVGYQVLASDIADHGYGLTGVDFLRDQPPGAFAAIVTNPPFGDLARKFICRALDLTRESGGKVAMLQRHEFDAPKTNHPLFALPFAAKLVLHKRPRWASGDKSSPRFSFAWYLWDWRHQGPPVLRYLPDPDKPQASGRLL